MAAESQAERNLKISTAIQDLVTVQRLQQRLLTGQSFVADETVNAVTGDFFVDAGLQQHPPNMDMGTSRPFRDWLNDKLSNINIDPTTKWTKTAEADLHHPELLQSVVWTDTVAATAIQMYETARNGSAASSMSTSSSMATALPSLATFGPTATSQTTSTTETKHQTGSSAHVHPAALVALHSHQPQPQAVKQQASDGNDAPPINLMNNYRPDRLFELMALGPWWSKLKERRSENREDLTFVLVCTGMLNRAKTDWQELLDTVRDYSVEGAGSDGMSISTRAACLFLAAAVQFMENRTTVSNSLQLHILSVFLLAAYPPLILQCGGACSTLEVKVASKAFPALWSQTSSSQSSTASASAVALVALGSMTKAVANVYGLLEADSSAWLSRLDPALSDELTLILGAEAAASTLETEVAASRSGFCTAADKLSDTIRYLRLNATLLYFWTHLPGGEQEARAQAGTMSSLLSSLSALEQRGVFRQVTGQRVSDSQDYQDAKNLVDATVSEQSGTESHDVLSTLRNMFADTDNAEEQSEEQPENESDEGDENENEGDEGEEGDEEEEEQEEEEDNE